MMVFIEGLQVVLTSPLSDILNRTHCFRNWICSGCTGTRVSL